MQFKQLFQFTLCALSLGFFIVVSACKKDPTPAVTSSKCDYAPYSKGSKFVYSTTGSQVYTDTILGDSTLNGVVYSKVLSTGPSASGAPSSGTVLARCDTKGFYQLFDKLQVGAVGASNFTPKEVQAIKLPATVGLAWKSDTIKYKTSQNVDISIFYKMQVTAVGGSKTVNGTAYANSLVTVQIKTFTITGISGLTLIDSSLVVNNVFDKQFGLIESSQNGTAFKSLKTSVIK
jgi:hypothetical protein